jgi:citrate synthase
VLDQLLGFDNSEHARQWVQSTMRSGERIAGFGHRHYRMPDPRVVILRKEVAAVARRQGREELFAIARAVEDEATRQLAPRGIHININFYAALLFHLLGADGPLIPCLFAVARMAGLVALVRESLDQIRLFRPLSRYVGVSER